MTEVLLERHWDVPVTEADLQMMANVVDECLGLHRVDWCGSLLSTDGAEMFCHFRSPDLESVRIAMRALKSPIRDLWPCTVRDAPEATGADLAAVNVVTTHRCDAPLDDDGLQALQRSLAGPVDGGPEGLVRVYVSNDRRRLICLYRASDVGSALKAQPVAGLLPEAAWPVRRYAPLRR